MLSLPQYPIPYLWNLLNCFMYGVSFLFFLLISSSYPLPSPTEPSVTYLVHPPQCAHKVGAAKFTEREEAVATGVHFVKDPRRDRARVPKCVCRCVGGAACGKVDTDMKRKVRLGS